MMMVRESPERKTQNFLAVIKGPTLAFLPELALEEKTSRNMPKFQSAPSVGYSVLGTVAVVDSEADNFLLVKGPTLAFLPVRTMKFLKYWVETSQKRYGPCVADCVLRMLVDFKDNYLVEIKGPLLAVLPELALEVGTRRNVPKLNVCSEFKSCLLQKTLGIYQSICRPPFYVVKHNRVGEALRLRFGPNEEDPGENNGGDDHLLRPNGQDHTERDGDTEDDEEEPGGGDTEDDEEEPGGVGAEGSSGGLVPVYRYTPAPNRSRNLLGSVDHRGCLSERPGQELHDKVTDLLKAHIAGGGLPEYEIPTIDECTIVYYSSFMDDTVLALSCPDLKLDWEFFSDSLDGVISFDDEPGDMVLRLPNV